MAEFEELRLTVNLVDNASVGLVNIRTELGQLTGAATNLTTAFNSASSSVTSLGNATNKTAPGVRNLNAEMREAGRYANELKDGFARMGQAAQGLQSLPAIAGNVRDLGMSLQGLSTSFSKVSPMAGAAVIGIGAVAIAVVGLGAAVVAYGVSVFKFAKEMDQLGKTARQMGVAFSELKYAQDEAKKFGQSAESITRSFQAVGDAQFNLSKNNSSLRSRLIGMGVEANWVNQLAAMEPNKARNAVITYGKALERQMLEAGVAKNVARAMMNQFGAEFGLTAEDMDMPLLKDPDPKTKAELERIAELSKQIGVVWGEIGAIWDDFSTEILAMGLPIVLDALKTMQAELPALLGELKTGLKGLIEALPGFIATIPETLTSIRETMTDVANVFRDVKGLYDTITGQTSELTNTKATGSTVSERTSGDGEKGEGAVQQAEREKRERDLANSDLARGAGIDDIGTPPPAAPSKPPEFNANRAGRLERPALPPQHRYYNGGMQPQLQSFQGGGGANDNNPLLVRASFTQEELIDETGRSTTQAEKLTQQLEKLNAFFDRADGKSGGQATGGGIMNASYSPDGGVGSGPGSGGGGGGGASSFGGGGYVNLGPNGGSQSGSQSGGQSGGHSSSGNSGNGPPATGAGTQAPPPGQEGQYRPKYNLTDADLSDQVVNTIAGEARGSQESTDAVINNMFNRLGTKAYGPSGNLQQVARAPGQYAGYQRANPARAAQIRERIKAIASGAVPDATGGANEFRTTGYSGPWSRNAGRNGIPIGGNTFAYNPQAGKSPYAPYAEPKTAQTASEQPPSATGPVAPGVKVDDSIEGRKVSLQALRDDVEDAGVTTTSGYRDPKHKLSGKNPHSKHIQALAFDSRAKTPEQADRVMAAIKTRLNARGLVEGKDYRVDDEVRKPVGWATAKHIHTQLTPEGMRKYQQYQVAQTEAAEKARVAAVASQQKVQVASLDLSAGVGGRGIGLAASQASRADEPGGAHSSFDAQGNRLPRLDPISHPLLNPDEQPGGKHSTLDAEGNRLPGLPPDAHAPYDADEHYREGGKWSRYGPNVTNMRRGGRFTQPNRGMLERSALTSATTVRADGSVKVEVGDSSKAGTAAKEDRLFAETPMQRQEAGQLTSVGPNAHETAKQYMASR